MAVLLDAALSLLRESSSLASYHTKSLLVYRENVQKALRVVVKACQERCQEKRDEQDHETIILVSSCYHYRDNLLQSLLTAIAWKDHCRDFDQRTRRRAFDESASSLAVILQCIQNEAEAKNDDEATTMTIINDSSSNTTPTTIRVLLQTCLIVDVCLVSSLSSNSNTCPSPSQTLLFSMFESIMNEHSTQQQSNNCILLSELPLCHVTTAVPSTTLLFHDDHILSLQRFLSILQQLQKNHCQCQQRQHQQQFHPLMLPTMELLLQLDQQMSTVEEARVSDKKSISSSQNDSSSRERMNWSPSASAIDRLHNDCTEYEGVRHSRKRQLHPSSGFASYKSLLQQSSQSCNVSNTDLARSKQRLIAKVRGKAIKLLLSILIKQQQAMQISVNDIDAAPLYSSTWDDNTKSYFLKSPSVRLCYIATSDNLYTCLTAFIWQSCQQKQKQDESVDLAMFIYAEMLVEVSFFQAKQRLLQALQPLLFQLDSMCQEKRRHTNAKESQPPPQQYHAFLSAFLYIYYHCELQLSSETSITGLFAVLSTAFEQPSDWWPVIHKLMEFPGHQNTRRHVERYLSLLYSMGILSVVDSLPEMMDCDSIENNNNNNNKQKPFVNSLSLRSVVDWFAKTEPSSLNFILSSPRTAINSDDSTVLCKPLAMDGNMEAISDNTLHHVFSFLNFKSLQRCRSVCRDWKTLLDHPNHHQWLWRQLYESRFGLASQQVDVAVVGKNWKQWFMDKWLAEREIRWKRHKSGWRYRVCSHVGCLQVLKSPIMAEKHMAKKHLGAKSRTANDSKYGSHHRKKKRKCTK